MNIELKPIAESKVRQLGGDVCGVLVRTEDSEVMAVSEHGRCTRLDAGVMGPVEPSGMSDYTKLPRNIADCMSRAGSPLSEDQKLILAGYLAPVQEDLAKAKEENERVRQANLHTMDVFEDMKAAKEQAEARVAELEAESLQAIANKVCGELPEGWMVGLYMENGAAWVEAIKPSGYTIDIDRADLTLAEQVIEALKQATGAEQ